MRTELITTLQRKATDIISRLAADQEPVLITQYGLPAADLVDVRRFDEMQERLSLFESIVRGEKAIL